MKSNPLLSINNLTVTVDDKTILSDFTLKIFPGEIHAIMGPNGSGKTTLANVLARHPDYTVTQGSIIFNNVNLLELTPEQCAAQGLFLSFQYPVAIPGVSNVQFLKSCVNAIRKQNDLSLIDAVDFLSLVKSQMKQLGIAEEMLQRAVNDGFSGGEKKRNEILQMALLQPKLAILDETDSGLDIDSLKAVAEGINYMRTEQRSMLLITHYQRLLDYVQPNIVHVMLNGKLVHTGDHNLPKELEHKGYAWLAKSETC